MADQATETVAANPLSYSNGQRLTACAVRRCTIVAFLLREVTVVRNQGHIFHISQLTERVHKAGVLVF